MVKVKICGITNRDDALAAVKYGADALGFIFYKESPRYISPEAANDIIKELPPFIVTDGVFVNENVHEINKVKKASSLDRIQLHGDEIAKEYEALEGKIIKAFRVKGTKGDQLMTSLEMHVVGWSGKCSAFLFDTYSKNLYGGTGRTFNWEFAVWARKEYKYIILSGGLTPENVSDAVKMVRPYAVDVSSGVEKMPGKKDLGEFRGHHTEFLTMYKGK